MIRYCEACEEYTLLETHSCGNKTQTPQPPKYSPQDRYAEYRREAKRRQGLL